MPRDVEFPELRARVAAAIDALAEPYSPDPSALAGLPGGTSQFSEIFDLLCEELDLATDPRSAIGYFLKSEDEARALAELAPLLQAVWDEVEQYASDPAYPTDDEFQRAPTWPEAVESARRARDAVRG